MVLSDRDIKKYLKDGKIKISPMPDLAAALGSCSIDLRLGFAFRVFNRSQIPYFDPYNKNYSGELTSEVKVKKNEPFVLQPGDFVLATTIETFALPDNLLARLEGRSSLGRLGIVVHSTASIFEPGWRGKVVMEMGNQGRMPVALYPGMRVCALTFEELSSSAEVPYHKKKNAKYLNQKEPLESKIGEEK
ncbi:dCTP deaminase [Candidatus Gottesmanbacteria bacterium]|nr:dCTP deaminase [Candidatus Gottesmanbacteria bacterium]MBI5452290.1 dCTP deaminase [Candidatus Gottesmanbacteria bacterium]